MANLTPFDHFVHRIVCQLYLYTRAPVRTLRILVELGGYSEASVRASLRRLEAAGYLGHSLEGLKHPRRALARSRRPGKNSGWVVEQFADSADCLGGAHFRGIAPDQPAKFR